MKGTFFFVCTFAIGLGLGLSSAETAAESVATQGHVHVVAMSGQSAPGTPSGVRFRDFESATINSSGQIAFLADLTGPGVTDANRTGIWLAQPNGTIQPFVREGDTAPGIVPDATFERIAAPLLNDSGNMAFRANLAIGNGVEFRTKLGNWTDAGGGGIRLISRQGDPAPQTEPGTVFQGQQHSVVTFSGESFSQGGKYAFAAFVDGPAISNASDRGIWVDEAHGGLTLRVREGDPIPGLSADVRVTGFALGTAILNPPGEMVFRTHLTGADVTPDDNEAILTDAGGGLRIVAREGDHPPGTTAGTRFRGLQAPHFNAASEIAFHAFTSSPIPFGDGIWIDRPGLGLQAVAVSGAPVPDLGAGVSFFGFADPVLGGAGDLAFAGFLRNVLPSEDEALWSAPRDGDLRLLAREGHPARGTEDGVLFGTFTDWTVNGIGRTAFMAGLSGSGVTSENDVGIWVEAEPGDLRLMIRTGDAIEVAAGDVRTISELSSLSFLFRTSGNEEGLRSAFNDSGTLVVTAQFEDGSEAILVPLPEPDTLVLFVIGAIAILLQRASRRSVRTMASR